eukprot:7336466-Alexandrium_andersonii.AAC.1
MWDHLWLANARRRRLGPPGPRDREQPLEGFAGPPLSGRRATALTLRTAWALTATMCEAVPQRRPSH